MMNDRIDIELAKLHLEGQTIDDVQTPFSPLP
jgi:hypothetical protein